MKIAIMQPYFLPYMGYFQLLNAVDVFVVYDNIQFTKKGWIHRNRFLQNGKDVFFSLPIKKDSDYMNIIERRLSENADIELQKILRRFEASYRNAPFYQSVFPLLKKIFCYSNKNLFNYLLNSIMHINDALEIKTKMILSSQISIDHNLKSQEKVIAICKALQTDQYINPIGGMGLYDKKAFELEKIELCYIQSNLEPYSQNIKHFVPGLSILDVMMFNDISSIRYEIKNSFKLI